MLLRSVYHRSKIFVFLIIINVTEGKWKCCIFQMLQIMLLFTHHIHTGKFIVHGVCKNEWDMPWLRWQLEIQVQFQASPCGTYVGQSGTGTGFSLNTSVFSCQYHSTNAAYSVIYLWLTLYCNHGKWLLLYITLKKRNVESNL